MLCRSNLHGSLTTWRPSNLNGDLRGPIHWGPVFPFVLGMSSMIYGWLRRNGIMVGFYYGIIMYNHHIYVLPGEWLEFGMPIYLVSVLFQAHSAHQILGFISRWCFISSWRACTQKSVKSPARIPSKPLIRLNPHLSATKKCHLRWLPGPSRTSSEVCLEHSIGILPMKSPYVVSIKVNKTIARAGGLQQAAVLLGGVS